VRFGAHLRRYAVAILDPGFDIDAARQLCLEVMGESATAQAASIVASFDGINRVADATGIRLDAESMTAGASEIIEALEIERLVEARA
jgi:hypothetical protein